MGSVLPVPDGFLVTTYDHCHQLVSDDRLVKDASFAPASWPARKDPASLMTESAVFRQDRPNHTRLRSLVARAFTPARLKAVDDFVADFVDKSIEHALQKGELDVIEDLASGLPLATINHMMGIPEENTKEFELYWQMDTIFDSFEDKRDFFKYSVW